MSKKPSETPSPPPLVTPVRCSVIQRTPKTTKREEDSEQRLPEPMLVQEPEQDQPIDYHIPKRKGETEDENEERKSREQRRSHCSKIAKPLIAVRTLIGKLPVTLSAAAGHGRSGSGAAQGNSGQSTTGSQSGGGTINFSGGSSGGGSLAGGTGSGGGMNPGRDGRQNYGPSSPPTGSLPPFYESLKGGNNATNNFNASGNYVGNNYNLITAPLNMDCDTGQEMSNNYNGGQSPPKQYSMLQNASYGLVMKDETDLDAYESKIDSMGNLLQGSYSAYDDAMMVDVVTGAVVDPLQFTATLTFSSSAEHALLESLSDAADLSSFLQRLPPEEENNENSDIITTEMNSPSLTPDSVQVQGVEQNIDSFPEQMLNRNYNDTPRSYLNHPSFSKMYSENLPSYQQGVNDNQLQVQVQMQQQQQMLSPSLSFNGSGLDLDSPTTMSLPSPGGASCSLDGTSHNENGSLSPPASVSGRRDSTSSEPSLTGRVNVLQQRVSKQIDSGIIKYNLNEMNCIIFVMVSI